MANFTYTWDNGNVVDIPLSGQTGFSCSHTRPDSRMTSAANEIISHAGDSNNLNDVEKYCEAAYAVIDSMYLAARNIRDGWDQMEIDCANWNTWVRWCEDKGRYCYMSENELESAYYAWKPLVGSLADAKASILDKWQKATAQLVIDGQQATDQALLDNLIAQTNNTISLTAYQNESRELAVAQKKSKEIFLPVIIGLVVLGAGFYFIKK